MILPDVMIRARLTDDLVIHPLAPHAVQPSSVDLRLGPILRIATPDGFRTHDLLTDGPYRMGQHDFILGATLEHVIIPDDLVGVLVGKSSRAREGIQVEAAGYVDPGWEGNPTLEIVKLSCYPVSYLCDGMLIAQIRFEQLAVPCARPYGHPDLKSKYQGSVDPVESRAVVGRTS